MQAKRWFPRSKGARGRFQEKIGFLWDGRPHLLRVVCVVACAQESWRRPLRPPAVRTWAARVTWRGGSPGSEFEPHILIATIAKGHGAKKASVSARDRSVP